MNDYRLSPLANEDILEIWAYISRDNINAADELEAEIVSTCKKLAENPSLGHPRRDLTQEAVLFYPVRSTYLIIYKPETNPLEIARVLHGYRDVSELI